MSIKTEGRRPDAPHRLKTDSAYRNLLERIGAGTAEITVIGLGHVGLPTAVLFANAGYGVVGVDAKKELVQAIASSRVLFDEPGIRRLLKRAQQTGRFRLTTNVADAGFFCRLAYLLPCNSGRK